MHSNRMRTVRCSGHLSCHTHPHHHACPPLHTPPAHAPPSHHTSSLPCTPAPRAGTLCHARPPPPPRTEFLTHACENITVADGNIYSQSKTTDADTAKQIDFLAILYNRPARTVNKFDHVPFVNPTQYRILINPQSVP